MTDHHIRLSDAASRRLQSLSAEQGRALMLRVAVDAGGCSGFQYRFDLIETAEPDDFRIEHKGAVALVDPISAELLAGSTIDFVIELIGSQFRVHNPQATASCGCGVSFAL